ncbi:MAG: endonuclease III [Alphaproteobacteria bacterium]|nr:MAG: endonuclease III [Alphaproteobacteria bacterium]
MISHATVAAIFQTFAARNPEPETELVYTNNFTLLVAVVLSAQSTDTGVNKATRELFFVADTPQKMVRLGPDKIRNYIRTIGLTNTKAKNVYELSKILCENYEGCVPAHREDLEKLPGVGRKTANVVLNVAFNQPTMAVDTHIFRVSNRIGLTHAKTPRESEDQLLGCIPPQYLQHAHHWLILHGRYICKARTPNCSACPIAHHCTYFKTL